MPTRHQILRACCGCALLLALLAWPLASAATTPQPGPPQDTDAAAHAPGVRGEGSLESATPPLEAEEDPIPPQPEQEAPSAEEAAPTDPFETLLRTAASAREAARAVERTSREVLRLRALGAPSFTWDVDRASAWLNVPPSELRTSSGLQARRAGLAEREHELASRIEELQALENTLRSRRRTTAQMRGEAPLPFWHPEELQLLLLETALEEMATSLRDERILTRQRLGELLSLQQWLQTRSAERSTETGATAEARERLDEARRRLDDEGVRTEAVQLQAEEARRQAEEARSEALDAEREELAALLEGAGSVLGGLAIARVRESTRFGEIAEAEAEAAEDRDALLQRIEAILNTPTSDAARAERAWTMHRRLLELRRNARAERRDVAERLDEARTSLDTLEGRLAEARALEEELLARQGGDERLRTLRRTAGETHVRAAEEGVALATLRRDRLETTHRLHLETLLWTTHAMDRITPALDRDQLAEHYALSSAAIEEARRNLQDRWLLWSHRLQTWPEQLTLLRDRLFSLEGLLGGGRLVLYLALFALLLVLFARRRDAGLRWLLKQLEDRPWAERHWRWVLKTAELVRDLTGPVAGLVALRLIFSQIPADLLSANFFRVAMEAALLWAIVMRALRTCLVPHARRRRAQDEEERFGVDIVRLEERTLRLVLLSAQILLLYMLFEWVAGAFVSLVLGPELIHHQLSRLLFWGRLALIYLLLWAWRHTIVESFVALTKLEDSRSAQLLRAHRDRPYSVLFLFFLAAYLLAQQTLRIGRTLLLGLRMGRRLSNFLFRKRIELANAREAERPEVQRGAPGISDPNFLPDLLPPPSLEVIREDLLTETRKAWLTWRHEPEAGGAVAIIGERYMGKTTLLCQIADHLARGEIAPRSESVEPAGVKPPTPESAGPCLQFALSQRAHSPEDVHVLLAELFHLEDAANAGSWSEDKLAEALIASPWEVVLLDECHNLFIRRIGGFAAIDRFLRIVSLTRHHLFWVLSFNLYAWRYLNRVQDRRHFFRAIIQVPALREEELRLVIDRRNEAARITPDFSFLARSGSFAGGNNQHYELVRTSEGFLRLLREFSEGNPGVALVYWARSLRRTGVGAVEVTLFQPASDQPLKSLSDQQLFSLTAIAQHENLNASELAGVINGHEGECRLDMNLFLELRLIRLDASRRARLDPFMQRQVLRRLRDANLLYLNR